MPQTKQFDLNLFPVFLAVYRCRSFSRAAEQLNLTQSSVSNAINRLKKQVDEELFNRVGRGVEPTAAGHDLYQQLDQHFNAIDGVVAGLEKFDPKIHQREFYVYANEVIMQLLQAPIDKLTADLAVDIIFKEPPSNEEQLQSDLQFERIDLAVDIMSQIPVALNAVLLMRDKLVCVARKDHPRIQDTLNINAYFAEKHVIFKMRRSNLAIAELYSEAVMPQRKTYSEQSSVLTMLATASKSDAIAIASTHYLKEYAELFNLTQYPLPFDTRPIEYHMIWSKKLQSNRANAWLREMIALQMRALET
ncbi:LysR family transcriptional regulator [Shewanella gelidimarina]|uniref:LysR family transcriptional regulator n=1 Tax=Shewanella gelidimarina TaxID=56813 RepID=UPI00200F48D1|nr:LysR family transcriptional regulator [Shewanella gelidimarina]MCL1057671.1 LysR family transcriptional regulator [Shewanella gelidimarina]